MNILTLLLVGVLLQACSSNTVKLKEGDVVFQSFEGETSKAIKLATHSQYSHVGLVLQHNNQLYVFEAIGPVQFTPVEKWIDRGENGYYVVRRLKDSTLLTTTLPKLRAEAEKLLGKPYDFPFNWSDEKEYCSEAVWKCYERALGIHLGEPQPLRSFDLTSASVINALHKQYGNNIPYEEPMISPQQVLESSYLYTVE